jgi:uncharacterized membrane protein YphA (DoxX/SURF4 family)
MAMSSTNGSSKTQQNVCAGAALVTLLAVQIIIGWEWLASGITKVASGTFVSGLAGELHDKSRDTAGWYRSFLDSSIIPNAHTFGVLIEVGEIAVGLTFIIGGTVWLTRWSKLSDRLRVSLLGAIIAAALAATFMAINFHLANDGNHPWLIPKDGFDETIDVDSMLVMIQVGFMVFCGYLIARIHRRHQPAVPHAKTPRHGALPTAS